MLVLIATILNGAAQTSVNEAWSQLRQPHSFFTLGGLRGSEVRKIARSDVYRLRIRKGYSEMIPGGGTDSMFSVQEKVGKKNEEVE